MYLVARRGRFYSGYYYVDRPTSMMLEANVRETVLVKKHEEKEEDFVFCHRRAYVMERR